MSGLARDEGYKQYLVETLHGGEALRSAIDAIWKLHSRWVNRPLLHYLYARREAIQFLIGNLDEEPTAPPVESDGPSRAQLRKQALFRLLEEVTLEIAAVRKGGRPSVGTMTAVAFVESPVNAPDANGVERMGDPNVPPIWVVRP